MDASNIDKYLEPEFTLNEVSFRVNKLNAMDGFALFEIIRKELATTSDNIDLNGDNDADDSILIIKAIASLEPTFVEKIRKALFSRVQFKGNGAESYVALAGTEEMAFQNLEPIDVYEVLLRALAVNFTGSFRAIKSRSQSLQGLLKS